MEKTRVRHVLPVLLFLALMLAAIPAPADLLLRHAASSQAAGESAVAADLYLQWLHVNVGAPGAAGVFDDYFSAARDFASLVAESRRFLVDGRGLAGAAAEFLRIARLFDATGRLEDARGAYLQAFDEGASDAALLSAGLLSVEMNDPDGLADVLARGKGRAATALLDALAGYRSGDRDAASKQLVDLAAGTGDPGVALKAMWILSQAGTVAPSPGMSTRFAGSPEAVMAASPVVSKQPDTLPVVRLSPSPGALAFIDSLAAAPTVPAPTPAGSPSAADAPAALPAVPEQSTPSTPSAPTATAATAATAVAAPTVPAPAPVSPAPAAVFMVQAGAFQVRENADDLVNELARKGFPAAILAESSQGRQRFRVMAATGLTNEDAQAMLLKLTKAGYSGFVASQKPDATFSSRQPSG